MADSRMAVATMVGLWLMSAGMLDAQTAAQESKEDGSPTFGVLVGAESVPVGLDRSCGDTTGRRELVVFGAFAGLPVGPLELRGQVTGHWRNRATCFLAPVPIQDGTFTEQVPEVPPGSFAALDVRLRWVPRQNGLWVVSAGAGWAASAKDVPYVSAGLGVRPGMWGVDLEISTYRVRWTERIREYWLFRCFRPCILSDEFVAGLV